MSIRSALFLLTAAAMAQGPRFDVASVKIWPERTGRDMAVTPTGVSMPGIPLGVVIRWAYGLHTYPGFETVGPDWLEPGLGCIRFDIQAKNDHPVPVDQLRLMMRSLLAERFRLAFHRETREETVCVIEVAKGGPKLHASAGEEMAVSSKTSGILHFKGAAMPRLYETLYAWIPYLILDETGLKGRYDFELNIDRYRDEYSQPGPRGAIDASAAVGKAFEPLGLKLELKRRSVEVLVIDHAEKSPLAN